ncbi:unnamed protein product [Ilex paraguariensis]|uniref:Uncharacterized protein n=1 Tax=Ilex paraguariensis TaxID=185542 RepID=A0ABC8QW51_9AQUA
MGDKGGWSVLPPTEAPLYIPTEDHWRHFDNSGNAVSFGFVATAILIFMFLVMAIFERFLRPTSPALTPAGGRRFGDIESQMGFNAKFGLPSPKSAILKNLLYAQFESISMDPSLLPRGEEQRSVGVDAWREYPYLHRPPRSGALPPRTHTLAFPSTQFIAQFHPKQQLKHNLRLNLKGPNGVYFVNQTYSGNKIHQTAIHDLVTLDSTQAQKHFNVEDAKQNMQIYGNMKDASHPKASSEKEQARLYLTCTCYQYLPQFSGFSRCELDPYRQNYIAYHMD